MQIDEMQLGATSIKFFDDYIDERNLETIKDGIDTAVSNAIQKITAIEKL